jgi:hypothetical protein
MPGNIGKISGIIGNREIGKSGNLENIEKYWKILDIGNYRKSGKIKNI